MQTVLWRPPVSIDDLNELSHILARERGIVSSFEDFRTGSWEQFFRQQVYHNTRFFAHIDSNVLSQVLALFRKRRQVPSHGRHAAALMALAITFDMKVNPTFAVHEYALTGDDNPDKRLAAFYFANNLDPQHFVDVALRRTSCLPRPDRGALQPTKHAGGLESRIHGYGLAFGCLLKILEIHTDAKYRQRPTLTERADRILHLLDWMFHDFLFCAPAEFVAHELWGRNAGKSIIRKVNAKDVDALTRAARNAAWDLTLAQEWAERESGRLGGDPIHLVFTLDKSRHSSLIPTSDNWFCGIAFRPGMMSFAWSYDEGLQRP